MFYVMQNLIIFFVTQNRIQNDELPLKFNTEYYCPNEQCRCEWNSVTHVMNSKSSCKKCDTKNVEPYSQVLSNH